MAQIIKIHPDNPQANRLEQIVECLRDGGIIIYPTDTVYGFGCNLYDQRAIERLCRIKSVKPEKMHLSFICADLSDLSLYTKVITTPVFRVMKKALPGAFTFILESSKNVPKIVGEKKKEVGIRVPNHKVPIEIVKLLGNPILTTSVKDDNEDGITEYMTDPELMAEKYEHSVDMVIDSGYGGNIASTVVYCVDDSLEVLREGAGDLSLYL